MKLWLRILWIYLTYRSRSKLSIEEVSRVNLVVLPNDLDTYGHINNGVYLTIMDLGRLDQGLRTGIWQDWKKRGWYPVVVNATI
ncbi:MAG TPA: thioesterase family protein, partial [Microbacteriaceae bacterium]